MNASEILIKLQAKDETAAAFKQAESRAASFRATMNSTRIGQKIGVEKLKEAEQAIKQAEQKQRSLNAAVSGMRGLIGGNTESLNALTGQFGKLGNAIAGAGLMVGAFIAAWKIGIKVQGVLWKKLVDDIKIGSKEAAESIKSLGDMLAKSFTAGVQSAGEKLKGLSTSSKDALAESERQQGLAERRARAQADIGGAGRESVTGELAQAAAGEGQKRVDALRKDAEQIKATIDEARRLAEEAQKKYEEAGDKRSEIAREYRRAAQASAKELEAIEKEGKTAIKNINDQIEEQEVRILEAKAEQVKAEKAIADAEKARAVDKPKVQQEIDNIDKQIAEAEKAEKQRQNEEAIQDSKAIADAMRKEIAGIAANKQERWSQRAKEQQEKSAAAKEAELIERRGRGVKLGKDAEAFLARRELERAIAAEEKNKADREKLAAENAKKEAQRQHTEMMDELKRTRALQVKLLQSAGG